MKKYFFLVFLVFSLFNYNSAVAQAPASTDKPTSRTIEDGGTGPYKALMLTESSLPTHTVFRPKDLSAFGEKNKLPIIVFDMNKQGNLRKVVMGEKVGTLVH